MTLRSERQHAPRWARPALLTLLALTAALYIVGLSASGWANSFYSAAVQAGSQSWEAFFFGSSDAANSITVDKPPASLWIMALSVRVFGLSSWSILIPQAIMGVATVGILYSSVRGITLSRLGSRAATVAGLLAGAALATTPVATLIFRFNNPDALLVLLMTGAAASTLRSIRTGRARWIVLAGVLIGFGFLTKQLQVLLPVPGLVVAYAVCAPHRWWPRVRHLLATFGAMVVSAGWWVVAVMLTPATSRPYVGGSQHNSILELTLGYNGFGRLTGNETGSVGGGAGPGGGGMWGDPGLGRLFGSEMGGQIAWLLPAALILLVAGLVLIGRARRTDAVRAALIAWGGWVVITGLTFSLMSGIIHPYYMVALAPGIGALIGINAVLLWQRREQIRPAAALGAAIAATGVMAYVLLRRTPQWSHGTGWVLLIGGVAVGIVVGIRPLLRRSLPGTLHSRIFAATACLAVMLGLGAPAASSVYTASMGHSGSIVSAGPTVTGGFGGPGGGGRPPGMGGFGEMAAAGGGGGFAKGSGEAAAAGAPNRGTMPPGGQGAPPNASGGSSSGPAAPKGQGGGIRGPGHGVPGSRSAMRGAMDGGMGGLLNGATPSNAMVNALRKNASHYTWAAATIGADNASGYQLATELPVMPIGGFNGTDPSPSLAHFTKLVAQHKIHYFIASGMDGGGMFGGANSVSSQITTWVKKHYTATTIGGTTVYDLTR